MKKQLKVYYGYTGSDTPRPFIRLCGAYLKAWGFQIGDKVELSLENEKITITKVVINPLKA